jgi:hypothetical protein
MITQEAIVKVYVNHHNEGTVTCPHCDKSKRLNFAKQKPSHEPLKVKCACGNSFKIIIELRSYYRKRTRLHGHYATPDSNKSGSIIIEDLSFTGLGFRTRLPHSLQLGEVIALRFVLDNKAQSEVQKKAIVRRIQGYFIGAQFCDLQAFDKQLGYYLMPG